MSAGTTLFRLVRSLTGPGFSTGSNTRHGRMVIAVEAVHAAKQRRAATINDIATELGIDQSGASRLMSQAITAGLVQRESANEDGRVRECGLTPAGQQLLESARKWQDDVFARLTEDWDSADREAFVRGMERMMVAVDSLGKE